MALVQLAMNENEAKVLHNIARNITVKSMRAFV